MWQCVKRKRCSFIVKGLIGMLACGMLVHPVAAQAPKDKDAPPKSKDAQPKSKQPPVKLGLSINDPKALQGYTLLAPLKGKDTYLIDMQGKVVRMWKADCHPALVPYLLENGNLFRPGELDNTKDFKGGPGTGGRIQEFDWDGNLVWDFKLYNDKQLPHHDAIKMPNGNVMLIVSDKKTPAEAIAAGRRASSVDTHLLADSLIEVKPTGKTTGEVVWEWHLWDHLVQDVDKDKPSFAKIPEYPQLVDINYGQDVVGLFAAKKGGAAALKGIGYVGNTPPPKDKGKGKGKGANADWTHFNGVAYNADLDQLIVSVHNFSEFWIIDHSTSTSEAATHNNGRSGKGGDLLYRWGNPRAYGMGTKSHQRLFAQHNAHWIAKGLPGAGHILVFNNGGNRTDGTYSSVDEIVLPVDDKGNYLVKPGTIYGPDKALWSYSAPKKADFYSSFISGTQRLANGNTLICSGANGTIFEVTPDKELVWRYVNPVKEEFGGPGGKDGKGPDGKGPGGKGKDGKGPGAKGLGGKGPGGFGGFSAPRLGELLPLFVQDMLKMSDEQKKQLKDFEDTVAKRLDKILTPEQLDEFKDARPGFGPGQGGPPKAGQVIPSFVQDKIKLGDDQKKELVGLQKDADQKLEKLLTGDQRKQLQDMAKGGFGPGGPGGPFGGGPPGGSSLFRAYRYALDYAAFTGRTLTPGKTVEEMQPKEQKKKESKGS